MGDEISFRGIEKKCINKPDGAILLERIVYSKAEDGEERGAMKPEEINIYREVQKNAEMAIKAIETLSDKVYEDDFALQISRQALKYSDIRNRAMDKLLEAKAEPVHPNHLSDMMLKGAVHMNTLFNTSTGHLAELMIQGSNRGITEMCKAINHNPQAQSMAVELAKELMDFEEKNIGVLKKYL